MVGRWATIMDAYSGRDEMVLHRDGRAELDGLDSAQWSSDGESLTVNGTPIQFRATKGCNYITFADDISPAYPLRVFVKEDPLVGCPTAPDPLTKTEAKLVGSYELDPPYDAYDYLEGSFELHADRTAIVWVGQVHTDSYTFISDKSSFNSEGQWHYDPKQHLLSVRIRNFSSGSEGIDWDLDLDDSGTPVTMCLDGYACSNVVTE